MLNLATPETFDKINALTIYKNGDKNSGKFSFSLLSYIQTK